jgi:acetyl-CoA carboxylase biotin carboxyl carrier protein
MMPTGKLDKDSIRELAEILKQTDLSEIEYEANGVKIRVARQIIVSGFAQQTMPSIAPLSDVPASSVADIAKHPGMVKSPMVGTGARSCSVHQNWRQR